MVKICHFSSVHIQEDIRIFHKECRSLADAGYETYLVTKGESCQKNGINLIGIGEFGGGRKERFLKVSSSIYKAAKATDADIYHFHDPELLPYGIKLKKKGKKVIFDSHEDVPAQISGKKWIPWPLRKIVSKLYRVYETYAVRKFDAVVAATPHIAEQFIGRAKEVVVVNNYPRLDDIEFHDTPFSDRAPIICYAGGISEIRGESIMIEAMKSVKGVLILAGEHEVMEVQGGAVSYIGQVDRKAINELYGKAVAGLCLLKPVSNYYYSKPIKIYEYMAAGIPFICSDFPGWKKVTEESGCGISVDINDVSDITRQINFLLNHRDIAQKMGRKGYQYVSKCSNWTKEGERLINLYYKLGQRD